jgi:hypothetical protein
LDESRRVTGTEPAGPPPGAPQRHSQILEGEEESIDGVCTPS